MQKIEIYTDLNYIKCYEESLSFKGSGTLNLTQEKVIKKSKIALTSLKKVAKYSQRSNGKRFAIFLVFNVKKILKRSAWRAMMCATKQKWILLLGYSSKQVLLKEELLSLMKYDNEYLRFIANSPPLSRLAHWVKRAHSWLQMIYMKNYGDLKVGSPYVNKFVYVQCQTYFHKNY